MTLTGIQPILRPGLQEAWIMTGAQGNGGARSAFRATSAWIPLLLAGAATALAVGYLATGPHEPTMVMDQGAMRPEEGPAARLWQLLMVLQLPAIGWFAVNWLPRDPRRATAMLTLQTLAVVAAAAPVVLLEM